MRDLLKLYFSQMGEHLVKLNAAILAESPGEVRQIAHRCAGSSASCGMLALVPLLRDLERLGHEGGLDDAPPIFAELERKFEIVRSQLHEYVEAPQVAQEAG